MQVLGLLLIYFDKTSITELYDDVKGNLYGY